MATISSHVLDSIRGDHARGMRVDCFRRDGGPGGAATLVFSTTTDVSGRLTEEVEVNPGTGEGFELVFYTADYFSAFAAGVATQQIMPEVVVRVVLPEPDTKYHLPLVLSPHSYTLWWSGVSSI